MFNLNPSYSVRYAINRFIDDPCKVHICRKITSYLYMRRIHNTLSILYNSCDETVFEIEEGIKKCLDV